MSEESIRIQDIIDSIKKRWVMILTITLVITATVSILNFFVIKPKYKASTKLFIGKESVDGEQTYNNSDVQLYKNLLKTYSDVIQTNDLVTRAFTNEGIDLDSKVALNSLTVEPKTDTQILEISFVSGDKQLCMDVVGAIADEFVTTSTKLISNSNVQIIEQVKLPENPISPNKKLNIAIAFLISLLLSIGIALLMGMLDTTVKDKEKLEEVLGLPVLGVIPDTDKIK
ncbi:MAG: capsular biosynthesis protein [Clostridiales bacterium]|nr:capsular biosynthesis protein [Clostridiales bacterium]